MLTSPYPGQTPISTASPYLRSTGFGLWKREAVKRRLWIVIVVIAGSLLSVVTYAPLRSHEKSTVTMGK
jgi:hypothetical protein